MNHRLRFGPPMARGVETALVLAVVCLVAGCSDLDKDAEAESSGDGLPVGGVTVVSGGDATSGATSDMSQMAATGPAAGSSGAAFGADLGMQGDGADSAADTAVVVGAQAAAGTDGSMDVPMVEMSDAGSADMGVADAGAPSGFTPCPESEPCAILPLGDSITDGIGFAGSYRVELFRLALADGKSITYVGGSMNGPTMVDGVMFPRNHEGHSGWTIDQIDGIVPEPALAPDPHIVLLHIGTNDMYRSPAGAPDRLADLIDQIVADLPDALLVVATIIPLASSTGAVDTFNAAIPAIVEERAAAGKHVILVDQFEGFPTSELGDGVHPNEMGYARMAGVWYDAIRDVLH